MNFFSVTMCNQLLPVCACAKQSIVIIRGWFEKFCLGGDNFNNVEDSHTSCTFSVSWECPFPLKYHYYKLLFRLEFFLTWSSSQSITKCQRRYSSITLRKKSGSSPSTRYAQLLAPHRQTHYSASRRVSSAWREKWSHKVPDRSGLYDGCSKMSSNMSRSNAATVCRVTCGQALSC